MKMVMKLIKNGENGIHIIAIDDYENVDDDGDSGELNSDYNDESDDNDIHIIVKVRKTGRIRNRYNQVPHLSQDTKWESNEITINITNKGQEVSPFPSGDHKTAMNRRESMTNTRNK